MRQDTAEVVHEGAESMAEFSQDAVDDTLSLNSEGVEVHHLSETGGGDSPALQGGKRRKPAPKKQNRRLPEANKENKATVDPCKYKTKLCRSWMRDGYCSYEGVCCYAHGEQDVRTVHQNTQVLSSLGYFSELMLLAIENEGKGGQVPTVAANKLAALKGKRASKDDIRAAQVEASLVHFARNSTAKRPIAPPKPNVPPRQRVQMINQFQAPMPMLPQHAQSVGQSMVHAPYASAVKQSFSPQPLAYAPPTPQSPVPEPIFDAVAGRYTSGIACLQLPDAEDPRITPKPYDLRSPGYSNFQPQQAPQIQLQPTGHNPYAEYKLMPQQYSPYAETHDPEPPWKHPPSMPAQAQYRVPNAALDPQQYAGYTAGFQRPRNL